MPTSFTQLVREELRQAFFDEENVEKGKIWIFSEPNVRTKQFCCM